MLQGLTLACSGTDQSIRNQRISQLEGIAEKCGLPRSTFKLVGTDDLRIEPPPGAEFQSVECALNELKKTDIPFAIGFVGNEAYK